MEGCDRQHGDADFNNGRLPLQQRIMKNFFEDRNVRKCT